MFFKKKPQQKLEDMRAQYAAMKKQQDRNIEAANLKRKIFAMKHPTMMNIAKGMASEGRGKSRVRNAGDVFAEVDKKFGGW